MYYLNKNNVKQSILYVLHSNLILNIAYYILIVGINYTYLELFLLRVAFPFKVFGGSQPFTKQNQEVSDLDRISTKQQSLFLTK